MRVAAIQTTAGANPTANRSAAGALVEEAARSGAELAVLPEYFSVAGSPSVLRAGAELLDGPTIGWARDLARRVGIRLVAGSFPELPAAGTETDGRVFNTSCLIGPAGTVEAVYRKIHLFDADIDGTVLRESATIAPGASLCTHRLEGGGPLPTVVGLSICYDLRFPELYRILALSGATLVAVPAAFTATTGPAHWEVLLRARAVENELYVVAAGQVGELPPGMPACHGHSMIVDPWGSVMAERADASPGFVLADLDLDRLRRIRSDLPVLANRRPSTYRWPDDSAWEASDSRR
jgi:deaminated glutathione amidase